MATHYTKEELWVVYEKLPEKLQQSVFSGDNADQIFASCERHEVQEVSKVAYYVGLVLLGVLLPNKLEPALVKELGLKKETAQAVAADINRSVFYPVKAELEEIHGVPAERQAEKKDIGVTTPRHSEKFTAEPSFQDDYIVREEPPELEQPEKETSEQQKPKEADQYRELPE